MTGSFPDINNIMLLLLLLLLNLLLVDLSQAAPSSLRAAPVQRQDYFPSSSSSQFYDDRQLAVGDWDNLKNFWQDSTFAISNYTLQQAGLDIALTNIICSQLVLGDLQLSSEELQANSKNNDLSLALVVVNLGIDCTGDYVYSGTVGTGQGRMTIYLREGDINVAYMLSMVDNNTNSTSVPDSENNVDGVFVDDITTADESSQTTLLNHATLSSCKAKFVVEDIEIDAEGGFDVLSSLIQAFNLKNVLATELSNAVCDAAADAEANISTALHDYFSDNNDDDDASEAPLPTMPFDPLWAEDLLLLPVGRTFVPFRNATTNLSSMVELILGGLSDFVSQVNNNTVPPEPALNSLVRNGDLLNDEGAVFVNLTGWNLTTTPLVEESLPIGDLTVHATGVGFRGLDAFTKLNFSIVGDYTLYAAMQNPNLTVDVHVRVALEQLHDDDGNNNRRRHVEDAIVSVPLGPLDLEMGLFLAMDEETLGDLSLGKLLQGDDGINCFLSTLYATHITSVKLHEDIVLKGPPVVSGSETTTPGLQRLLSDVLNTWYKAFYPSMAPGLANNLRNTTHLDQILQNIWSQALCTHDRVGDTTEENGDSTLDLRDFLLPPAQSHKLGGTGSSPLGALGQLLKTYLDDELLVVDDPTTGRLAINDVLIQGLTQDAFGESGTLSFPGETLSLNQPIVYRNVEAAANLTLRNVVIHNLDTLSTPTSLLDPMDNKPHTLYSQGTLGSPPLRPLHVKGELSLDLMLDQVQRHNELTFEMDLVGLSLTAEKTMRISETKVMNLPLEDYTNVDCLLSTLHTPILDIYGSRVPWSQASLFFSNVDFTVDDIALNLTCVECENVELRTTAQLLRDPASKEDAMATLRLLLDGITTLFEGPNSYIQNIIDQELVRASRQCPSSEDYDPFGTPLEYEPYQVQDSENDSLADLVIMLGIILGLVLVTLVVHTFVRWVVTRRNHKFLQTLPEHELRAIYQEQQDTKRKSAEINSLSTSIFASTKIPVFVRWLIPGIILGNIALFVSGHISPGGALRLYIQLSEQNVEVDDVYTFSLARTVLDLWRADARALSIIMFATSILWPYVKQLLSLAAWCMPPNRMSIARRGWLLQRLDSLGKWSMVDVFVMFVALAAFRFTLYSPSLDFLQDDLYVVDFLVAPMWGLISNFLAQIVSQIASHFIIHYHGLVEAAATERYEVSRTTTKVSLADEEAATVNGMSRQSTIDTTGAGAGNTNDDPSQSAAAADRLDEICLDEDKNENVTKIEATTQRKQTNSHQDTVALSLYKHIFRRPHRGDAKGLHVPLGINIAVLFGGLSVCALVVLGFTLDSFSTSLSGIVGVIRVAGQDEYEGRDTYSILSLARTLVDNGMVLGTTKDIFVGYLFASALILSTVVVPLALTIGLLLLWFYPLPATLRKKLGVGMDVLSSWQYLQVFLITLIFAVWQLSGISESMSEFFCSDATGLLAQLAFYGALSGDNARCFGAQAHIEVATYLLIGAVAILGLLRNFVSLAGTQAHKHQGAVGASSKESTNEGNALSVSVNDLDPMPILFTDRFRWLLESVEVIE